jgi:carbon-monoxide dehydrogenase small subunit
LGPGWGRYLETIRRSRFDENPDPTDGNIRNYLAGNLCRCATYPEVQKAVKGVAELRDK